MNNILCFLTVYISSIKRTVEYFNNSNDNNNNNRPTNICKMHNVNNHNCIRDAGRSLAIGTICIMLIRCDWMTYSLIS